MRRISEQDLNGDGYLDLIIANTENGVTSDLDSYVYWGGKDGLTEERSVFPTEGATINNCNNALEE